MVAAIVGAAELASAGWGGAPMHETQRRRALGRRQALEAHVQQ
jgi:hypothetical protein